MSSENTPHPSDPAALRAWLDRQPDTRYLALVRWQPVSAGLPDLYITVILHTRPLGQDCLGVGCWDGEQWHMFNHHFLRSVAVLHWAHLPDPPKQP